MQIEITQQEDSTLITLKSPLIKPIAYYILVFLGITIVWNVVLRAVIIPKSLYKTTATVIDLQTRAPNISGGGRMSATFPTYQYKDDTGRARTFESRDGFNVLNGLLFKKELGKSYSAYYEKGSENGLFVTGTGDWATIVLAPLVIAVFPIGPIFALILYLRFRSKPGI